MTDGVAITAGGAAGSGAPGPQVQPPVRPTWSPVEEARKKAELAMAAAAANGTAGVAPAPGTLKVPHHTLIPRMMVLAGIVASLIGVFSVDLLVWLGEAQELQGRVEYTERGRLVRIALIGGSSAAYLSGWVWWTAAASANARHKSRNAGSPVLPPLAHAVLFAVIAIAATLPATMYDRRAFLMMIALFVAWLVAYVGVLLSFMRSAKVIKAPTEPWARMLWLPVVMFVTAFVLVGTAVATGSLAILIAGGLLLLGMWLWYLVSVITAMKSFDHACRVPNFARSDGEVPAFMRMAMAPR